MRQFLAQLKDITLVRWHQVSARIQATVQRYPLVIGLAALGLIGVFAVVAPIAHAQQVDPGDISTMLAKAILEPVINFLGSCLGAITNAVIEVSQYNGFTNASVVVRGWVIVRDVVNMGFIAMMLYIAFSTMFGAEHTPIPTIVKLMLGAIIINFSRTIIGLGIDLSQVVMLTFVNGIKDAAGGNFVELFQIREVLEPSFGSSSSPAEILSVHFLAITMLVIALFTMVVLLVFLVVRIVYLWILTIMSPLAFFGYFAPHGSGFHDIWGQWVKEFTKQLKSGPILAFFLWLALLTVQATGGDILNNGAGAAASSDINFLPGNVQVNIQTYVVGIILILQGMKYATENGGDSFKTAKGMVESGKKYAQKYASKGAGLAWKGTKTAGKAAIGGALGLADATTGFRAFQRDAQGKYQFKPTLQGTRVSDLAAVTSKKITQGLGLDKASRERAVAETEIAKLRRRGQTDEANKMEQDLQTKLTAGLLKKNKPEQLYSKLSSLKGQDLSAALQGLAEKKHGSMFGQGAGISAMLDKQFGGKENVPKGLEYAIRSKLKTAGDKNAFVGFDEDTKERVANSLDKIADTVAVSNTRDLSDLLKGVSGGVMPNMYAAAADSTAKAKLMALNSSQMDEFRKEKGYKGTVKEIDAAMANLLAVTQDPAEQMKIMAKMNELGVYKNFKGGNNQEATARQEAYDKMVAAGSIDPDLYKELVKDNKASSADRYVSIGDSIRGKINSQRLNAMKQGVGLAGAFTGFGSNGMAANHQALSNLSSAMSKKDNAITLAKNISADTLTESGGRNHAAIALFSSLNEDDMMKMAKEGNADAVLAMLQAADGLNGASADDLADQYQKEVLSHDTTLDEYQQIAAANAYEEQVKTALNNVSTIQGMRSAIKKNVSSKLTRTLADVGNVVVSPVALVAGAYYGAPVAVKAASALASGAGAVGNAAYSAGLGTSSTVAAGTGAVVGGGAVAKKEISGNHVVSRAGRKLLRGIGLV